MATVNLDITRAVDKGEPWWVAQLSIRLDDGTPITVATAMRESDLRTRIREAAGAVIETVGCSPPPMGAVQGLGATTQIETRAGTGGLWILQHHPSGDVFRTDKYEVINPAGNVEWSEYDDHPHALDEGRAMLAARAARTDAAPSSRPAVMAYDIATAALAGLHVPDGTTPTHPSGGVVKVGTQDAAAAQSVQDNMVSAIAQRVASGAVPAEHLDPTNPMHAAAAQLVPLAQAGQLPPAKLPGGVTVHYEPATPPPAAGQTVLPALPADAYQDPSTGYIYAPSTNLYYDPSTHVAVATGDPAAAAAPQLPADTFYDPNVGLLYSYQMMTYYDPSTGAPVAQGYPSSWYLQPQAQQSDGYGGGGYGSPADMWSQYGGVHGTVGDLWADLGRDLSAGANALLGNDVVQKVLEIATPILTVLQPELGLALGAGQAAAHAALSGAVHPATAAAAASQSEQSSDPLERLAASVFRVLTGG